MKAEMSFNHILKNIARGEGLNSWFELVNKCNEVQLIEFTSQAMEVYSRHQLENAHGQYIWTSIKQSPMFSACYIVQSNLGTHPAWYDRDKDYWETRIELARDSTFTIELIKWTHFPKA